MTKRKQTAARAYAEVRDDNAALLDLIGQELKAHAEKAAEEPRNWGCAGDLSYVREQLTYALAFLMNSPSDEEVETRIKQHLAEMRR